MTNHEPWQPATPREFELLKLSFQRSARHRGLLPNAVFVVRGLGGCYLRTAMQYLEPGKWERWGIQKHPQTEIVESWSTVESWLRPLIGDRAAIELYPRPKDIVNTAPIRWFWVIPAAQTVENFVFEAAT